MCLYLFNTPHTGTTTSNLKISKNIMVTKVSYECDNAFEAQINGIGTQLPGTSRNNV